jgi:hypothetical protein
MTSPELCESSMTSCRLLIASIRIREKSLMAQLGRFGSSSRGNVAAISTLQAFINDVEAQRGIHIGDADALIASAQQIIALLGG